MSDELLHVLNAPGDDESALARLWEDFAMRGIDEDSDGDSQTRSDTDSGDDATQAGNDGVQSDDEFDMLATDIDVAMARAAILPEYVLEEKEDIQKASLFRFVPFVHSKVTSYCIALAGLALG